MKIHVQKRQLELRRAITCNRTSTIVCLPPQGASAWVVDNATNQPSTTKQNLLNCWFLKRVGNRERGLQSQQRETKKERDAWGSFTKDEEVSQG